MAGNPYTLVFGKEPAQVISRTAQIIEIVDTFREENPSQQVYIITGVRGSGKTVLMTEAAREIASDEDWVVVELNPERDMLESFAAKLSSEDRFARLFQSAKLNLSFFGLGLEVGGTAPITDIEVALEAMIAALAKQGKRVLVTVDEAASTQNMKAFANSFQILIRRNLPLFLLMTGLHENIRTLQDQKSLTFLYRAPKIATTPLNLGAMAANYRENLALDDATALEMARLTKGYPFAFQVLGYLSWRSGSFDNRVRSELRQYLEDYVYEKIWSELSEGDRIIAHAIALSEEGKVSSIRESLGYDTNHFNPYRKRLVDKGIVDGKRHGFVRFTLPLFDEFVRDIYGE